MLRVLSLLLLLATTGCGSATAWDPAAAVPNPIQLPDGMDANNAHAYYAHGQQILNTTPARAAEAFYWASRLDPTWADPIYARRMALLMSNPTMFNAYLKGTRRIVRLPGVQRLDSLYLKALVLNPFLLRQQDAVALRYLIIEEIQRDPANYGIGRGEIEFAVTTWLARADFTTRGWLAQSEGRLAEAAELYERALQGRSSAELMADLARLYVHLGRFHDARENMARAIDLLREQDEDDLVRLYNSKALFEYSLGMVIEEIGDLEEARAAYARALQEDLSYHPAHMRLGELALAAGDTVTALSEMALAAEISTADAGVSLRYGRVLASVGEHEAAEAQFRRAIQVEPMFAYPHFDLARTLEALDRTEAALAEYQAFLEKAPRTERLRAEAESRIRAMAGVASHGSGT